MLLDLLVFGAICFAGGAAVGFAKSLGGERTHALLALTAFVAAIVIGEPDSQSAALLTLAIGFLSLNRGISLGEREHARFRLAALARTQ